MKTINIQSIQDAERDLIVNKDDSYIISYKEFIAYFAALPEITEHNFIIGAHFTYGWMPTIIDLRLNCSNRELALQLLNDAKKGRILNKQDFELLANIINNSLVGTSKLLHFIRPDKYAIWDSRVYWFIHKETPHHHRVNNTNNYIEYLKVCAAIKVLPEFNVIHNNINLKMGYEVTSFRAIEFIMYNSAISQLAK